MDRNARRQLGQHRKGIADRAGSTQAVELFGVSASSELLEATESLTLEHRERRYPPTVPLSMFMRQTLEASNSCQKAVKG